MSGGIKGLAAVVFAALVLYAMQRTTPTYSEIVSPVRITGEQGERVDAGGFAIGIAKVHLARTVTVSALSSSRSYTTSGVWVVIEGAAVAKRESLSLTRAEWLGPSGIRYGISQRFQAVPGLLGSERLEPGIARPILMIFEVPEGELSGATLLVPLSFLVPLQEEAAIRMSGVRPEDVRTSVSIGRGNRDLPWTLKVE